MKKALILGGSHRDIPLITAAKNLGYYVISLGDRDYYVGHNFSHKSYKIDFNDLDNVSKIINKEQIDVLVPGCGERALLNTVLLSKKFNIGNLDDIKTIQMVHNKWKFKEFCISNDINVPKGIKVTTPINVKLKGIKFPCIIKPVGLSGGNGVSVANNIYELKKAIKLSQDISKNEEVLVEEFIEGKLIAYSVFIRNKNIIFSFTAKDDTYINKYLITTAYSIGIEQNVIEKLKKDVEKIATKLNFKDGPFHLQVIIKDSVPYIIDVTRRIPGDLFPYLIEFSTGVKYSDAVVKTYAGEKLDDSIFLKKNSSCVIRHCIMASQNGILRDIHKDSNLNKKLIYELYLSKANTKIDNYLRHQIGIVLFKFDSQKRMMEVAKIINELIYPIVV